MARATQLALASSFIALPAWALRPQAGLDDSSTLEVYEGVAPRAQAIQTVEIPEPAKAAWDRFVDRHGPRWRAVFDDTTGVPTRIYGRGIETPDAIASAKRAEEHARRILAEHLDLLAPGARESDFALVANDWDAGAQIRTVAFAQSHDGIPVLGGAVSFRFKADRLFVIGSEAIPNIRVDLAARRPSDGALKETATKWIAGRARGLAHRDGVRGPYILSVVRRDKTVEHRAVFETMIDTKRPLGAWAVYLDASTGRPVARRQTLMFASGTVLFNTPIRQPMTERRDEPAPRVRVRIDGNSVTADEHGVVEWNGDTAAHVEIVPQSTDISIVDNSNSATSTTATIEPNGTFAWNRANIEFADAQLVSFIAATRAKSKARALAPTIRWLANQAADVNVNVDEECNAVSDGTSVYLFRSSRDCQNTGRIPDVVYHEFAHSFHAHAIVSGAGAFDTSLSEGLSDYFAASITGDPGTARGFFYTDEPLRHIDPASDEAVWPDDIGEPHTSGLIIAGALWDLRKQLIADLGEADGAARADAFMLAVMRRASSIPTSGVEILAADDDDGDLSNGTPNGCVINAILGRHGLGDPTMTAPRVAELSLDGFDVRMVVSLDGPRCPENTAVGASVEWRIRGDEGVGGVIPLELYTTDETIEFSATLPEQRAGTVLEYRVRIDREGGDAFFLPDNAADPFYQVFIGDVIPLYCTDFENDPNVEGWSHELLSGRDRPGADDWEYGAVASGNGSGDPSEAFSGTGVYGNDLGGEDANGRYQRNKVNTLRSPAVPTGDYANVRLQFRRWLTVENGHYDKATIYSNEVEVWKNLDAGERSSTHHVDREWRFQDVDLSATVNDGAVQVRFELASDGGEEFGGWTIDDFCIVAFEPPPPICGNGAIESGEECDDGNDALGDGCVACRVEQTKPCEGADCAPIGPIPTDPAGLSDAEPSCGCSLGGAPMRSHPSLAWIAIVLPMLLRRRRR